MFQKLFSIMIYVRTIIIVCRVIILLAALFPLICRQQPTMASLADNSTEPGWPRSGCYRVASIRTISIPGCVKFRLSSHGCSGYCVSYSIPETEEMELQQLGESREPLVARDTDYLTSSTWQTRMPMQSLNRRLRYLWQTMSKVGWDGEDKGKQWPLDESILSLRKDQDAPTHQVLQEASARLYQDRSPESPNLDVISVSQCCNMMETEDIYVKVRCIDGMKQFKFKSAKRCGCFFCKQT